MVARGHRSRPQAVRPLGLDARAGRTAMRERSDGRPSRSVPWEPGVRFPQATRPGSAPCQPGPDPRPRAPAPLSQPARLTSPSQEGPQTANRRDTRAASLPRQRLQHHQDHHGRAESAGSRPRTESGLWEIAGIPADQQDAEWMNEYHQALAYASERA
jgi:hypothetical protein